MDSLWLATAKLPSFPALEGNLKTDVLVIGGGLCGLLCAHALTEAGVSCALIEADRIMHGVSARTTAKITSQHRLIYDRLIRSRGVEAAQLYREANEAALGRYRRLCAEIDCGFEEKDAFVYDRTGSAALEREWTAMARAGLHATFEDALPLPFPVAGALRLPHQAQFHPLKFAAAIAEGLNIFERTAALAWDGRAVVTNRGRITADKVIVATHFPLFNKHGAYFLKLYQHRSYVLALRGAPDVHGMYLDAQEAGLSFRNSGEFLLLGGGSHRTGKSGGGYDALQADAKAYYPDAEIAFRWATQDCMTLDGLPYIGQYARSTPDLYVATGFGKWGMTLSMAAATILRDLVLGRSNPCALLFTPSRSIMKPQLLINGLEAAVSLLTPTRPRCPHMGCALKWNPQEHTWDCACHGSRFTQEGRLISGPATGDLPSAPPQKGK